MLGSSVYLFHMGKISLLVSALIYHDIVVLIDNDVLA